MKQKMRPSAPLDATRMQAGLLPRILALIQKDGLAEGDKLPEVLLARRLQVSRTPVRSALAHLAGRGAVNRAARGFVAGPPEAISRAAADLAALAADPDALSLRIAADRQGGTLAAEVSEADVMRRYAAGRATVQRVLTQLAALGVVERRTGHGWCFLPSLSDPASRTESYRFRSVVEPAALLEPGHRLAPGWIASMREQHEQVLAAAWSDTGSIVFYEMNAAFHEGLAEGSGNRFMLLAVQQQNRLRRLSNYHWGERWEREAVERRVVQSCTEHLEILARVAKGEMAVAAALMRQHLQDAAAVRRTP